MGTKITRVGALVVLLTLLGASGALAQFSADLDSVYINTTFNRVEHGSCAPEVFGPSWNGDAGSGDTCTAPTDETDEIQGKDWCHFKILTEDGSCMLWNSLLTGVGSQTGSLDVIFAFPVGVELTENNAIFAGGSDYDDINASSYWHSSGLEFERGQTYRLQITAQMDGCGGDHDQEQISRNSTLTIPCCEDIRANVDCDTLNKVNLADITRIIDYLNGGDDPCCWEEADFDGDSDVDTIDRDKLIDYVYKLSGWVPPEDCP